MGPLLPSLPRARLGLGAAIQLDQELIGPAAQLTQLGQGLGEQAAHGRSSEGLSLHQPPIQPRTKAPSQDRHLRSGEDPALALQLTHEPIYQPKASVGRERELESGGQPAVAAVLGGGARRTGQGSRGLYVIEARIGAPAQKKRPTFYRGGGVTTRPQGHGACGRVAEVKEREGTQHGDVDGAGDRARLGLGHDRQHLSRPLRPQLEPGSLETRPRRPRRARRHAGIEVASLGQPTRRERQPRLVERQHRSQPPTELPGSRQPTTGCPPIVGSQRQEALEVTDAGVEGEASEHPLGASERALAQQPPRDEQAKLATSQGRAASESPRLVAPHQRVGGRAKHGEAIACQQRHRLLQLPRLPGSRQALNQALASLAPQPPAVESLGQREHIRSSQKPLSVA